MRKIWVKGLGSGVAQGPGSRESVGALWVRGLVAHNVDFRAAKATDLIRVAVIVTIALSCTAAIAKVAQVEGHITSTVRVRQVHSDRQRAPEEWHGRVVPRTFSFCPRSITTVGEVHARTISSALSRLERLQTHLQRRGVCSRWRRDRVHAAAVGLAAARVASEAHAAVEARCEQRAEAIAMRPWNILKHAREIVTAALGAIQTQAHRPQAAAAGMGDGSTSCSLSLVCMRCHERATGGSVHASVLRASWSFTFTLRFSGPTGGSRSRSVLRANPCGQTET